jgi:hypothetical protein
MRKFLWTCILILAGSAAQADEIAVSAKAVPLNPDDPAQTRVDALEFVAGLELTSPAPEWGGYSGMVMSSDVSSIVAISDVGHCLRLELTHDAAGKLTGVGAAQTGPLLDEAGKPVSGKEWSDAEAIAAAPGNSLIVAFERNHRLWRYAAPEGIPDGPAQPVEAPADIKTLPENSGIETLVVDGQGRITAIAESGSPDGAGRGWTQRESAWVPFALERSDGFEATDATIADDKSLILLERRYTEKDGPAARISLLPRTFDGPVAGYTLAVLRLPLSVDNFEDVAIQPAPDGGRYIYLLSDNNQNPQQRTLLLQFRLPPAGPASTP